MKGIRHFCPRALCGTWSASSEVNVLGPVIKDIFMGECFIVSSEQIAFVCIGSQFAAVRTLLPSYCRIGADAGSARANEVGEASIARFAPPTSRRGITEGGCGLWPQSLDGQPRLLSGIDPCLQSAPHAHLGETPSCGTLESRRRWNPSYPQSSAVKQMGQTTDLSGAAFGNANRLIAGLVLHKIRARDRSDATSTQRIGFSLNLKSGPVPAPFAESEFTPGPHGPLTITPAASSDPLLASIETLLVDLARRRLRGHAGRKRFP